MKKDLCDESGIERLDSSGFIHDLKSPLSVIKTFVEKTVASDEETAEFREAAMNSVDRVFRLIEGFRNKVKSIGADARWLNVAQAIRSTIEGIRPMSAEKGVGIRYIGPNCLDVVLDGQIVDRVVANLLINAIQASFHGGDVRVELFLRDSTLFISVLDNGLGIDPDNLPYIFDRGFTYGKKDGSGIGLNLCKRIVEDQGGSIVVFSKMGCGTVFTLSIPTQRAMIARGDGIGSQGFFACEPHIAFGLQGRDDTLDPQ